MPELTPLVAIGIILLGGIVGFLSGLFGVGGGFLLTPMLNIAFGIPMNIAIGSGLCQMIGTATTAALRHWKSRAVDLKLGLLMIGGTVAGVEVGARLLTMLRGRHVTLGHTTVELDWILPMSLYLVLLLFIGVTTLVESMATRRLHASTGQVKRRVGRGLFNRIHLPPMATLAATEGHPVPLVAVAYLAFGVGVMQGFLGLGGGIVIVPIMIYWIGCSTRMAVGTSLFVVAVSAIAGSISHALRDNVDLPLVLLVLVSSTLGAYAGAALHHRLKPYQVRFYFSGVLFAALSVIAIRMLFRFGIIS